MAYALGDWEAVVQYHADLTTFICTFGVRANETAAGFDVANDVAKAWGASDSICHVQSSAVDLDGVTVNDLTGTFASSFHDFSDAENYCGQSGSGRLSPQAAFVYTMLTGLGGRSHRGRIFVGGVSTDFVDGSRQFWTDSGGDFATAAAGLITALDGTGAQESQLCVHSRKLQALFDVTSMRPNLRYIGTQRRRAERFE